MAKEAGKVLYTPRLRRKTLYSSHEGFQKDPEGLPHGCVQKKAMCCLIDVGPAVELPS